MVTKTFEEKAKSWLTNNVGEFNDFQLKSLTILLKEQDRDTRHLSAENISSTEDSKYIKWDSEEILFGDQFGYCIKTSKAQALVMHSIAG